MKKEAREKLTFDVFLSHNSKDKPAVRALAALLTERGIRVWLDEEQLIPGRAWQPLLEKGIRESATGTVLVGVDGLGPWEDEEMQALLQSAVAKKKPVIPVLLPGAPKEPDLPLFLSNRTWVDLRAGFGAEGMDKLIWGIAGEHPGRRPVPPRVSEPVIAVTRLRHGADRLVGREKALTRLDTAWQDPKTHVVTIVAWGGVGKTALVVEWMARMARDGWRGAERVFDWSFYSQGTREQGAASADTFIAAALEFFGGEEGKGLAASPTSGWDKGAKLAQLVSQRRTLLVLDGLEPLQFPPGPVGGKLKDQALEALLKGLAQYNGGLCLVTTREPVADLVPFRGTTAPQWSLEHLSEKAGAQLLFDAGVRRAGNGEINADDKELKDATREVGGHALTLQLLGRYLAKGHNGDVRKRDLVAFHKADAKVQGGHAFKVIGAYEKWLAGAGEEGKSQLAVLHLLGLFDRPADGGCIAVLRKEPAIEGLTEPLTKLDDDDWNFTLANLVECGLISCRESQSEVLIPQSTIDCHPLIREYFATRVRDGSFWSSILRKLLRRVFPGLSPATPAWQAGHRRLYEHLCATTTDKKIQPTLEDLQPLYQAVAHGCQAGLHQEACEEVFLARIRRGAEAYSHKKLGAFGSDLGAIACFFEQPWSRVSPALTEADQAWLLTEAAFALRALGRLTEALEPMRAPLENYVKREDWGSAAPLASNLSELELTLGDVAGAVGDAEQSVTYADRSGDAFLRTVLRVTVGNALHQAGRRPDAEGCFREAERMQAERQPEYPLLYSLQGFLYCDLVLTEAERAAWQMGRRTEDREQKTALVEACRAVEQRATQTLKWAEEADSSLLTIALDHLTLGRAALDAAILGDSSLTPCHLSLDAAVDGLRRAGTTHHIPRGLLTRAWLRFLEGDRDGARADLDEAWEVAERGSMKLHTADIHLYRARLFGSLKCKVGNVEYPWESAQADLAAARKLIEQCGYGRRKEELGDAEEAIGTSPKLENGFCRGHVWA